MTTNDDTASGSSFRDSLSTVDKSGKRIWIYPKKVSGKFYRYRSYVSFLLLAILFSGPFLKINGEPILMLNVIDRKFVLFGQVFWPQDFHLFVLAFIIFIVFIVLFTVVFGRLFCGWVCPQTLFLEMVFRKIEYWIDGDWKEQQKLAAAPWDTIKASKRLIKHAVFFTLSFLISNTLLAYIIGIEELTKIITDPPAMHIGGLTAMTIFSVAFFLNFSIFREQACTTVCPYGRFQGVMLDRNSVVVSYDHVRGEPRGKIRKNEDQDQKGDCVDCKLCVHVCPTGIDIRNGTQLECVNCTACIDACNEVMDKTGKPQGLIRYASESEIADNVAFRFTGRMKAYSAVLVILIAAMTTLLTTRSDVETSMLRTPGMTWQKMEDGRVSNMYNYKIINKTNKSLPVQLKLLSADGELKLVGRDIVVNKNDLSEGTLLIMIDPENINTIKTTLKIGIYSEDRLIETVKTAFIGPVKPKQS